MPLTERQAAQWRQDGFFILRGFAPPETGLAMEAEMIAAIRADPPAAHADEHAYATEGDLVIMPEAKGNPTARAPEDLISKVFNPHLMGKSRDFALGEAIADIVSSILGPDIDVFQSQFIFKNPGAWGQPWHQDSFYFAFDLQPQIGVWLAISEATHENGCLTVLPGSHVHAIHAHVPDKRPGANHGYLEVEGLDCATETPVLMQPGDVLIFHSYLLHRSRDNVSKGRRSAMVYHYGRPGSRPLGAISPAQARINRWIPVRRAASVV